MAASDESCDGNPDFAVICSFITKFGDVCGVNFTIPYLQQMLEDTKNVHEDLADVHIHLLRRGRKRVTKERWEKCLIKFCHEYSSVDAWELERFGYKKAKLSVKLDILKRLLELQFDSNAKFKSEVNKYDSQSLRILPIGRDLDGQVYWYQLDKEYNMRLYRQGPEDESPWELLCSNTDHLRNLLTSLEKNVTKIEPFEDTSKVLPEEADLPLDSKMETDGNDIKACSMSETKPNTIIIKTEKRNTSSNVIVSNAVEIPVKDAANAAKMDADITLIENKKDVKCNETKTQAEIKIEEVPDNQMETNEVVVKKEMPSSQGEEVTPMEVDVSKTETPNNSKAVGEPSKSDIEMTIAEDLTAGDHKQLSPEKKISSIEKYTTGVIEIMPNNETEKISLDKEHLPEAKYKGSKIKLYEKWSNEKKQAAAAQSVAGAKDISLSSSFTDYKEVKHPSKPLLGDKVVDHKESSDSSLNKSKSSHNSVSVALDVSTHGDVPMDLSVSFRSNDGPSKSTAEISARNLTTESKKRTLLDKDKSKLSYNGGNEKPLSLLLPDKGKSNSIKCSSGSSEAPRPFKKKHLSMAMEESVKETSDHGRKSVIFEVKNSKLFNQFQENRTGGDGSMLKDRAPTVSGFSHLQALQNMCNENPRTCFQGSVVHSTSSDKRLKSDSGLVKYGLGANEKSSYNEATCDNLTQKFQFSNSQLSGDVKHASECDVPPLLLKSNIQCSSEVALKESSNSPVELTASSTKDTLSVSSGKSKLLSSDIKKCGQQSKNSEQLEHLKMKSAPVVESSIKHSSQVGESDTCKKTAMVEKQKRTNVQDVSSTNKYDLAKSKCLISSEETKEKSVEQMGSAVKESKLLEINKTDKNLLPNKDAIMAKTVDNSSTISKFDSSVCSEIEKAIDCSSKVADEHSHDNICPAVAIKSSKCLTNLDVANSTSVQIGVEKPPEKDITEVEKNKEFTELKKDKVVDTKEADVTHVPTYDVNQEKVEISEQSEAPVLKSKELSILGETRSVVDNSIKFQSSDTSKTADTNNSNCDKLKTLKKSSAEDPSKANSKELILQSSDESKKPTDITENPTVTQINEKVSSLDSFNHEGKTSHEETNKEPMMSPKGKNSVDSKDVSVKKDKESEKEMECASTGSAKEVLPFPKEARNDKTCKQEKLPSTFEALGLKNPVPCKEKLFESIERHFTQVDLHSEKHSSKEITSLQPQSSPTTAPRPSACAKHADENTNSTDLIVGDKEEPLNRLSDDSKLEPEKKLNSKVLDTNLSSELAPLEKESNIDQNRHRLKSDVSNTLKEKSDSFKIDKLMEDKFSNYQSDGSNKTGKQSTLPKIHHEKGKIEKLKDFESIKLSDEKVYSSNKTEKKTTSPKVDHEKKKIEGVKDSESIQKDKSPSTDKILIDQTKKETVKLLELGDVNEGIRTDGKESHVCDPLTKTEQVTNSEQENNIDSLLQDCDKNSIVQDSKCIEIPRQDTLDKESSNSNNWKTIGKEESTTKTMEVTEVKSETSVDKKSELVDPKSTSNSMNMESLNSNTIIEGECVTSVTVVKAAVDETKDFKETHTKVTDDKKVTNDFTSIQDKKYKKGSAKTPSKAAKRKSNSQSKRSDSKLKEDNNTSKDSESVLALMEESEKLEKELSESKDDSIPSTSIMDFDLKKDSDHKKDSDLEKNSDLKKDPSLKKDSSLKNDSDLKNSSINDLAEEKKIKSIKSPKSKRPVEKMTEFIDNNNTKTKSDISLKTSYKTNIKNPLGLYFVMQNRCLETKMRHPSCGLLKKIQPPSLTPKPALLTTFSMDTTDDIQYIGTVCDTSPTKKKRGRLRQKTAVVESKVSPSKLTVTKPAKQRAQSNSKKTPSASGKDSFTIPEGFLEILSNTQTEGHSAKKEPQRKSRGRKLKISAPSLQSSESESAPIKRSRRIQEQHQKKMSELAVEMEREQRILEQLAKKSVKKVVPLKSPLKEKEMKTVRAAKSKFQPPTPEETCMESKRTTRKMNSRSRNMTKMTLLYEDESKDSEFSTSRETEKSKKRRRGRGGKKGYKPWDLSSESPSSIEELTEEEEEEEHEEVLVFEVNEDEFACEEIEEDAEPIVVRRARTAKKVPEGENTEDNVITDDKPCSKCGKFDRPEWILLCDKCDNGYHTTCLAPPLMIIPDGDWYCQSCEHMFLCECLQKELQKLEVILKQREREELRKQRLAYVGISLDNVLKPEKKEKSDESCKEEEEEEEETDEGESKGGKSRESSEDERQKKLYGKRSVRARRNVNYQFKEYDELIASAIGDEMLGVRLSEDEEAKKDEKDEDSDRPFKAKLPTMRKKRKSSRRLNDLNFTDEDEDSGDEYKGSSSDSEQTAPPSSGGSDAESAVSGEWRIVRNKGKSKRKPKRGRRGSSDEEWDENDGDSYRPVTRRAAQKAVSYRELSSDDEDEWNPKPKAVKKRKKHFSSEESEASYKKKKPKKKSRVRKWASSDSSEESEKSINYSESSRESEDKWKVKKSSEGNHLKININKKVLSSDENESSKESLPKKRPSKIASDEGSEEDDDDEEEEEEEEEEEGSSEEEEGSSSEEEEEEEKEEVTAPKPEAKPTSNDKEPSKTEPLKADVPKVAEPQSAIKKDINPVVPPQPIKEKVAVVTVQDKVPLRTVKKDTTKMVPCVIPYDKSPKSGHGTTPDEESDKEIPKEKESIPKTAMPVPFSKVPLQTVPSISKLPTGITITPRPVNPPVPDRRPFSSTIIQPFSNIDEDADSDDEVPLERIPTTVPNPVPSKPLGYEREVKYTPAKELPGFTYTAPEEKCFPPTYSSLAPFQDYSSRPSPLKPSLVETYSNRSSPSKLTPLDSYSQTSSPKGFISLDSYSEARKKKQHFYGNPASEAEIVSRQVPPPVDSYQREIGFPPEPTSFPPSPSTYQRSTPPHVQRDPGTPPRFHSQYSDTYAPPRSPEYYQNHQYYPGEERVPRPAYQPNYVPPEQVPPYVPNPYVATPVPQPNGGFMIDTLLRARNPEDGEDELTGVTDIVSYITQE